VIDLSITTIPDSEKKHNLIIDPGSASDDKIAIDITRLGFLKSVNMEISGKAGDIIESSFRVVAPVLAMLSGSPTLISSDNSTATYALFANSNLSEQARSNVLSACYKEFLSDVDASCLSQLTEYLDAGNCMKKLASEDVIRRCVEAKATFASKLTMAKNPKTVLSYSQQISEMDKIIEAQQRQVDTLHQIMELDVARVSALLGIKKTKSTNVRVWVVSPWDIETDDSLSSIEEGELPEASRELLDSTGYTLTIQAIGGGSNVGTGSANPIRRTDQEIDPAKDMCRIYYRPLRPYHLTTWSSIPSFSKIRDTVVYLHSKAEQYIEFETFKLTSTSSSNSVVNSIASGIAHGVDEYSSTTSKMLTIQTNQHQLKLNAIKSQIDLKLNQKALLEATLQLDEFRNNSSLIADKLRLDAEIQKLKSELDLITTETAVSVAESKNTNAVEIEGLNQTIEMLGLQIQLERLRRELDELKKSR
jgi:hypothetical protein